MQALSRWWYGPEAPPPSPTFNRPWRNVPWGEKERDLQIVNNYQPHNTELQHLRILLHGPTGAGKSSFINSVDSVLQGRMAGQALVDTHFQGSFTIKHKIYKIQKGGPGTFYPFVFSDIMGFEKQSNTVVAGVQDTILAMKGRMKDHYKFNPATPLSEEDQGYNTCPALNDQVHVLVCVARADPCGELMTEEIMKKMREVRLAARDMGIPQLAILTKIDQACPEVGKNIKNVYKSKKLKECMEKLSVNLGLPLNCIFPVKNYHSEIDTEDDIDVLILSALKHMINYGEDFVNSL